MSAKSVKAAVRQLMVEAELIEGGQVDVRYPRLLDNSQGRHIVLWSRRAHEVRLAGSGRSAGPIHGVKSVPWHLIVHVNQWGQNAEIDYDDFEDFIDKLLALFRANSTLPNGADPAGGSVVLNFAEEMDIENIEPDYTAQFMHFQTIVTVLVEEIYNG